MPAPHLPLPEPVEPPGSFLFSDEIIKEITDEEKKHGIYTAERCPPEIKDAIIKLTTARWSARHIASTLHIHQLTVVAVRKECCKELDDVRGMLARQFRRVTGDQLDRLEQFPDMLPASSIPLAAKMFIETAELLEGKATSRVEHVERVDIFADYPAFLASLEMDAKNEALGIGDAGKKSALIAGELGAGAAVLDVTAESIDEPECNSKLQVSGPIHEANGADATSLCYESGSQFAADQDATRAPGGGSDFARPGEPATDNYSQNFWPNGSFEEEIEE